METKEAKTDGMDMTKGEPFKLLIMYSFPILLGQLFQQLYNMFDTIIVGRFLGADSLAAVGNTGPMNFLVLGFSYGMTSGFAVITAQKFGAHDEEGLKRSVAANILLNVIVGVFLTVLACGFTLPLLKLIHTPSEILMESFWYIFIIFLGIPVLVLYNGCACVLRAVGDSKTPLYFLIAASFLNIILDIVFIRFCGWGVAGAALATVIANLLSGLACLVWIILKFPILKVSKKDFALEWNFLWKHLNVGMNMGFQFSITAIGTVVLEGALNKFGATKMAAFTAAQKVDQLVTVEAGVMGVTMANYAGQNLGAGNIKRINEGVSKATIISVAFAVLSGILAWVFCDQLTGLFIDKKSLTPEKYMELLESARIYLKMCSVFFPILFVLFIYRNTLQGIGRGFWPLMGGVFELIARSVAAYTLPAIWGFSGICAAEPLAWCAASIPLGIAYYITIARIKLPESK